MNTPVEVKQKPTPTKSLAPQSKVFQLACDDEFLDALMKVAKKHRTSRSGAVRLAIFKHVEDSQIVSA